MIQYILECIAFQLVFLIIYDLFLKRETFFQWNRLYLIGTNIVSMVLPWIKIEALKTTAPEAFQGYPEFLWNTNDIAVTASVVEETSFNISWEYALLFGGMVLATVFFGYKLFQIFSLKRKGEVHHFKDFTRIIVSNSSIAFSFFKSIFLGDKVIAKEHQSIVEHELVHIRQRHSYDLMFFEIMRIVGWFNPLVYIYQNRVAELHEFIADAKVAKTNKKGQYEFLLSQVFQTQNISFINQFFKSSLIKKRIVMLTKEKSRQVFKLKYVLLIPVLIGMLFYTSCQKGINAAETMIVTNIENLSLEEEERVFERLFRLSESSGDWEFFVKDEYSSMKFIKSKDGSYLSGPNGEKIYARLAIDSKLGENQKDLFTALLGKREEFNDNRMSVQYNQLVAERERLLRSSNEKNPIIVNLDQQITALKKAIDQESETVPFANVDKVPVFPGCENEENKRACFNEMMQRHISKNFNYPKEAQEKGIQGRVSVMFTIATNGSIQNIRKRGPDSLLENEVERIIKRLPKMKPGNHGGKAVNVPFSIPVTFKLQGEKDNTQFRFSEVAGKSPLIIKDGKEFSGNVDEIAPDDVLEMHVLKGEKAIEKYGEKGKNGVVVITTKKKN